MVRMKHRSLLLGLIFALGALLCRSEVFRVSPGELPSVVESLTKSAPAEVAFVGESTSLDLVAVRNLPETVESLDMSGLAVKGCVLKDAAYFGHERFPDGELPPYFLISTHIKRVSLPYNTTEIGTGAFAGSDVESVVLPAGLQGIGDYAFYECGALKDLNIQETGVRLIGKQSFFNCRSLVDVLLPATLRSVGDECFMKSGVKSLSLPSLIECGDYAFAEMPELRDVEMRLGPVLGEGAFYGNKLMDSFIGTAANSPDILFADSGIRHHEGYARGEVLGDGAFAGLKMDSVVFYPDVRELGNHVFRNMKNLRKIDVTALGDRIPRLSEESFSGIEPSEIMLYVLTGTEDNWLVADGWKEFRISERASDVDEVAGEAGIRILADSGIVSVKSEDVLTEVGIYSVDGKLLHSASPGSVEYQAGPFGQEEIVIIKVATGARMRVAKMKMF